MRVEERGTDRGDMVRDLDSVGAFLDLSFSFVSGRFTEGAETPILFVADQGSSCISSVTRDDERLLPYTSRRADRER